MWSFTAASLRLQTPSCGLWHGQTPTWLQIFMCKLKRDYILPTPYVLSSSDLTQYGWMAKYSIWPSSYFVSTPHSSFDFQIWHSGYSCSSFTFMQSVILLGTWKIYSPRRNLLKQHFVVTWESVFFFFFLQITLNDFEVDWPCTTFWETTNCLNYVCNTNWKKNVMASYLYFTMYKGLKTSVFFQWFFFNHPTSPF